MPGDNEALHLTCDAVDRALGSTVSAEQRTRTACNEATTNDVQVTSILSVWGEITKAVMAQRKMFDARDHWGQGSVEEEGWGQCQVRGATPERIVSHPVHLLEE